jgi:hypothetical protein
MCKYQFSICKVLDLAGLMVKYVLKNKYKSESCGKTASALRPSKLKN